jgi:uncharacterized protein (DUF1501 family)
MNTEHNAYSRRQFLNHGLVLASAAVAVPAFLDGTARAMTRALLAAGTSSLPGVPDERILVVVQLSGGNDGLNTVVPFGSPEYYKARPGINIPEGQALKLPGADGLGLHPQLAPLREMYDEGLLAVVPGVGYPNPNRSHFKSMDIWHTADTSATGDGWLGKYFDSECCGFGKGESGRAERGPNAVPQAGVGGPPGIAIGRNAPLAMQGRQIQPVSFESADLFRWSGEDIHPALKETYDAVSRAGEVSGVPAESNAAFLTRTSLDAQVSSDLIRKAVARRPEIAYPASDLGRQLSMVASMISAGLKTRVYYVSLGGFDTHAGQGGPNGRHAQLLNQLAASVRAFYRDLKAQGNDDRVLTMSFSEFGRRVGQNASGGTDHGTAAPVLLAGPMVRPGVLTPYPSLKDLDDGDLKFTTDFRSVYAGVLDRWLVSDSKAVLEGAFRPVEILKRA